MNEKDIDIFIKAKKTQIISDIFGVASILMVGAVFLMVIIQIEETSWVIACLCFSFIFSGIAAGQSRWVPFLGRNWAPVSRVELMNIIERQINNDSDAIEYVSNSRPA